MKLAFHHHQNWHTNRVFVDVKVSKIVPFHRIHILNQLKKKRFVNWNSIYSSRNAIRKHFVFVCSCVRVCFVVLFSLSLYFSHWIQTILQRISGKKKKSCLVYINNILWSENIFEIILLKNLLEIDRLSSIFVGHRPFYIRLFFSSHFSSLILTYIHRVVTFFHHF